MSMPHQEAIGRYLASQGIGAFGGDNDWGIHVNREPALPHRVVTVYAVDAGEGPDTDELDLLRVGMLVRVRSGQLGEAVDVFQEAFEKQETIRDLLILPLVPLVTNGRTFRFITALSDIIPTEVDDNDRHVLTANFRALLERA